jgi:adenine-specific DNA-methyltransferase
MAGMTESEKLRANATGTELVWEGKRTQVERVPLPFQVIETINQSRATREQTPLLAGLGLLPPPLFESVTGNKDVWRNKLIWGDNKYVLASLLEEGFAGKINLIYIDPPFDTGDDFSFRVKIGDEELVKQPSIIEQKAYNDTWGKGTDSYLQMMYERLVLMRELLAENGSIYVHMDWHVGHYVKLILDEIFGSENFRNEIIWKKYSGVKNQASKKLTTQTDTLFWYSKSDSLIFNPQFRAMTERYIQQEYKYTDEKGRRYAKLRGRMYQSSGGTARVKYLDDNLGSPITTLWDDDNLQLNTSSAERLGYATQKPEALLARIVKASSNAGDLVADFFCGSGTTLAVARL